METRGSYLGFFFKRDSYIFLNFAPVFIYLDMKMFHASDYEEEIIS